MAREASLLGTLAVSFFPGRRLLAVDLDLISKKKLFHSRNVDEIVEYVLSNWNKKRRPEFDFAVKVVKSIVRTLCSVI